MKKSHHAALSDPGRTHDENQDRWQIDLELGLFVISDGMAEAVSPQLVVDALPAALREALAGVPSPTADQAAQAVGRAVAAVSEKVRHERGRRLDMLGATVVLALVRGRHALIAHLGDSRAYLLRAGQLERLTRDHSFVQRLVDLGWLTAEEAKGRSNGGPTRYAGMAGSAEVHVRSVDLLSGDRLLLCSDGLTEQVKDEALRPLLDRELSPRQSCERLVAAANTAGGDDNVTVIVIDA